VDGDARRKISEHRVGCGFRRLLITTAFSSKQQQEQVKEKARVVLCAHACAWRKGSAMAMTFRSPPCWVTAHGKRTTEHVSTLPILLVNDILCE
jgi:hypothetical protein